MAIDTPARLGIIGAGPTGLEACLYARFLGYDVVLFECGQVAERWQSDAPLGRFGDFSSTLGRAAIAAQNPDQPLPPLTEVITSRQWRAAYLLPLAECDLVSDCLRLGVKVTRVAKEHLQGHEVTGFDRGGYDFIVETTDAAGAANTELVDALIDASGWSENENSTPVLFNYALSIDLKLNLDSPLELPRVEYGDELPDGTKLTEDAKKLVLHEPNFYALGDKLFGERKLTDTTASQTHNRFGALPYSEILEQIRAIFTILGDRTTLDLYATAVKLPQ